MKDEGDNAISSAFSHGVFFAKEEDSIAILSAVRLFRVSAYNAERVRLTAVDRERKSNEIDWSTSARDASMEGTIPLSVYLSLLANRAKFAEIDLELQILVHCSDPKSA